MKSKDYKFAQLKHQLFQMRNARKKNPQWRLTQEQVEYIVSIGFPVKEYLYRIKTRPLRNVKSKCGILKKIHYAGVRDHKRYIYMPLSKRDIDILEENEVEIIPYKYEIHLEGYVGR